MWQVLKADLSYYKFGLLIGFGVCVLVAIASWVWNWGGLNTPIANSAFSYFITIAIIGSDADKDKRDRLFMLQPLSLRGIAHGRMQLIVLFQISIFLLWLVLGTVTNEGATLRTICRMFSFNALTLAMVMFFVIHHDLGFYNNKKSHKIYFGFLILGRKEYYEIYYGFLTIILLIAGLLAYFGKIRAVWGFIFDTLYPSPAGALLFSLIATGLYFLSINIFVRRKSYLA